MCPICLGAAAMVWAGTGSAGGLAAWVAMQLRFKPEPENDCIARRSPELNLQPLKAGGGK